MNRDELLKRLNILIKEYNETEFGTKTPKALEMETLLESYLEKHLQDTELWFKLSLAVYLLHDDLKSMNCLRKILEYEPQNAYALIMLAYMSDIVSGMSDDPATVQRLFEFKSDDNNIMSMVEYLKSKYFFTQSLSNSSYEKMQEETLLRSIQLCDKYVWNYVKLGNLYANQNKLKEALRLFTLALLNVKRVSDEKCYYDFLSVERFINEYVTGLWINDAQHQHLVSLLANCYGMKIGDFNQFLELFKNSVK